MQCHRNHHKLTACYVLMDKIQILIRLETEISIVLYPFSPSPLIPFLSCPASRQAVQHPYDALQLCIHLTLFFQDVWLM